MRRGDDAGDARVERELQDHAPHRRRRCLHGVHQPRRRAVEQEPDEQERQVEDVEVERVQRLAGRREVADEIGDAERDDRATSGSASARATGPGGIVRGTGAVGPTSPRRRGRCRDRAPCVPRPAGGVASHITVVTTTISIDDRHEALPEEDRVAEADEPAGDDAAVGDDVADLRLQRARRGHLQRRRAAQPLRPDAAEAEEARRARARGSRRPRRGARPRAPAPR